MYSQSHEAISSKHVVTCFEDDANNLIYNLPIGITAIDITKNGAVTYHHYIQATDIHKDLAARAAESLTSLADRERLRAGRLPNRSEYSCITDGRSLGYVDRNISVVFYDYTLTPESPPHGHDANASKYIVQLGAQGLWCALSTYDTPQKVAAKTGESFDITPTKDDLERAYIKRST